MRKMRRNNENEKKMYFDNMCIGYVYEFYSPSDVG